MENFVFCAVVDLKYGIDKFSDWSDGCPVQFRRKFGFYIILIVFTEKSFKLDL